MVTSCWACNPAAGLLNAYRSYIAALMWGPCNCPWPILLPWGSAYSPLSVKEKKEVYVIEVMGVGKDFADYHSKFQLYWYFNDVRSSYKVWEEKVLWLHPMAANLQKKFTPPPIIWCMCTYAYVYGHVYVAACAYICSWASHTVHPCVYVHDKIHILTGKSWRWKKNWRKQKRHWRKWGTDLV